MLATDRADPGQRRALSPDREPTLPDSTPPSAPKDRVTHSNVCRAYGPGEVVEIVASTILPPSKAYVHFDGERAPRLVWLDDLSPASVGRIVYPPERAGLRVVDAPLVA